MVSKIKMAQKREKWKTIINKRLEHRYKQKSKIYAHATAATCFVRLNLTYHFSERISQELILSIFNQTDKERGKQN